MSAEPGVDSFSDGSPAGLQHHLVTHVGDEFCSGSICARRPDFYHCGGSAGGVALWPAGSSVGWCGFVHFVRHQLLIRVGGHEIRVGVEHAEQDLAFVGLGAGQRERHRQTRQRAHQVQAQPPKEARMRSAVAVLGSPGQIRPFRRLSRAPHSTGVESTTHTSSLTLLVRATRCAITARSVPIAARILLL